MPCTLWSAMQGWEGSVNAVYTLECHAGVGGTCECPCTLWSAMQGWEGCVNAVYTLECHAGVGGPCECPCTLWRAPPAMPT